MAVSRAGAATQLILGRHGNTFAPGDRVVWVGRENDLPLVAAGAAQAVALAAALAARRLAPTRVLCGPLRRTRDFAAIAIRELGLDLEAEIDGRLNEIDYGRWAGRSAAEIAAEPEAAEMLRRWNEADVWPAAAGWGSTEAAVRGGIDSFLADMLDGGAQDVGERPLVVSSNGILRLIPRALGLVPPDSASGAGSFRMNTGHVSILERRGGGADLDRWRLACWNRAPEALPDGIGA